jgi:heat shock protein HtpX
MINALKRLAQKEPEPLPEQLAAFGIGEKPKTGWSRLRSSHPPMEDRIKALEVRSRQSN